MKYKLKVKAALAGMQAACMQELYVNSTQTLLEALRAYGLAPDAPCGGRGKCGKCGVTVSGLCCNESGVLIEYKAETVLSCCIYPAGDLYIELPSKLDQSVLMGGRDILGGGSGLGLAVDIGTTTLAAHLYDLSSGHCLKSIGEYNHQGAYGGDVISLIQYADSSAKLNELSTVVRTQIASMAKKLCADTSNIEYICIAGNTVMEHIFAGVSPCSIGVAPYEPECTFGTEHLANEYFGLFSSGCKVYISPAVSGFIGGDITAGLLGSGAYESEETVLFIDIGTNSEIALGNKQGFLCCSAAAGPAFEGGELECGSPARVGAIYSVDDDLHTSVIGGGIASSICGSGLIDAAAALCKNGTLSYNGRLKEERYNFGDVYLTAADIRKLQLAKAAVRAGIDTVAELAKVGYDDIDRVFIAGGFGAAINIRSACDIGLFPSALYRKIHSVGNAAGIGAAMALRPQGRCALEKICAACRYEELTVSPLFSEKYVNSLIFGEPDVDWS